MAVGVNEDGSKPVTSGPSITSVPVARASAPRCHDDHDAAHDGDQAPDKDRGDHRLGHGWFRSFPAAQAARWCCDDWMRGGELGPPGPRGLELAVAQRAVRPGDDELAGLEQPSIAGGLAVRARSRRWRHRVTSAGASRTPRPGRSRPAAARASCASRMRHVGRARRLAVAGHPQQRPLGRQPQRHHGCAGDDQVGIRERRAGRLVGGQHRGARARSLRRWRRRSPPCFPSAIRRRRWTSWHDSCCRSMKRPGTPVAEVPMDTEWARRYGGARVFGQFAPPHRRDLRLWCRRHPVGMLFGGSMGPRQARRIRRVTRARSCKEVAMIAIDTMRANVFHAPQEFRVEEVARPRAGTRGGADPGHADDDLRDRRPHREGRVPGQARARRRPRAGRRHRGARRRA